MNRQQLAAKIWESANQMRSKIEANEYKDYILGFIFYKFLSDEEEAWLERNGYEKDQIKEYVNEEMPDEYSGKKNIQSELGYFIAYKDLFSTWINMGSDFSVDNVRIALSSFTRLISDSHKKVFEGIFNTLETGLSKLGENTKSQTKAVSDLIHLIDEIPMKNQQDYDALGFIYEYLISMFASNAGKKAGEFYTPHEVALLMADIVADHLKGRDNIRIYDPTSGSGSLLLNIGKACSRYIDNPNRIRYYAQELKANTYNLTRMNLVMRGINPSNIVTRNGDTLEEDWPYFEDNDPAGTYEPLYVDAVVSNPPYSQRWEPSGKENDPRYARYGIAPKSKADYAFLLHDLYHLKPDGIMTIVLPHGVLFRGGEEGEIRKSLIEYSNIDAIIGLPANIFFGTGIPTIIMVLKQKRENSDVLIIDASKGFVKEGKNNKLRACDIQKIIDVIKARKSVDKFSRVVSKEEIRANDYNLNIPRYVDSSEEAENWDIYSLMFGGIPKGEVDKLNKYWTMFPTLKDELFEEHGDHLSLKAKNTKDVIRNNVEVKAYLEHYKNLFSDFGEKLDEQLIENAQTVSSIKAQDVITTEIFTRLANETLIDPYEAYEIFIGNYEKVSGDLELIQSEGLDCVRKVDPNMVTKKKNGKDNEVQEGWKGHVLPFELVQKHCLTEEVDHVTLLESRLQEIPGEYEEILDQLSEEDKETLGDVINETGDGFVTKNIKVKLKELKQDGEDSSSLIACLVKVETLTQEEKNKKAELKVTQSELHEKTKDTILSLTDEQVRELLHAKWIQPMLDGIEKLSISAIDQLVKKVDELKKKYDSTLKDIDEEIRETEKALCNMLSELTGNESDMQGIRELQKLLGGDIYG